MSQQYGIPDIRDSDGNLKGVDHTYEWNGRDLTIKHVPLTQSEQAAIEAQGENIEVDTMADLIDEKMVEPNPAGEWAIVEIMCYFEGIVDFATGGGGDLMEQAREELKRRAEQGEGN